MPSRVRRQPARRGFTLLEAVAALVVVGLSAAASLAAAGGELRGEGRVEHALTAAALAQQRLATLRLLSRKELERLPDSLGRGAFPAPLDRYHWRASSALVRGEADLFALRVQVEWENGAYAIETRHYGPRDFLKGR